MTADSIRAVPGCSRFGSRTDFDTVPFETFAAVESFLRACVRGTARRVISRLMEKSGTNQKLKRWLKTVKKNMESRGRALDARREREKQARSVLRLAKRFRQEMKDERWQPPDDLEEIIVDSQLFDGQVPAWCGS